MNWTAILAGLGIAEEKLKALIAAGGQAVPELSAEAGEILTKLASAVEPANLASLGAGLLTEAANIAKGKIDPREHPSDGA